MQFVVKKWYEEKIGGKEEEVRRESQPEMLQKIKIIAAPPSIHPFTKESTDNNREQYRYPMQHFYGYKMIKEPYYLVWYDKIRRIADETCSNIKECEYQLKMILSSQPDNEYHINFANKNLQGPVYAQPNEIKLPMISNPNQNPNPKPIVFPCMDNELIYTCMGGNNILNNFFKYVGTISININHERNTFRIKAFIFILVLENWQGILILNASPGYGFLKMEEISNKIEI